MQLIRTADETERRAGRVRRARPAARVPVQPHVHVGQVERYEVIAGLLKIVRTAASTCSGPGRPSRRRRRRHRQMPGPDGADGHVRVQVRPAGTTQAFIERLAELCADGQFNRFGFPKPVAAAQLVTDFGDEGHAARPPLAVQKALARPSCARPTYTPLRLRRRVGRRRAARGGVRRDRRRAHVPRWWRPVYIDVDADGPAELGKESRQHFKGRLPYHLHTRSTVIALDPPRSVTAEVDGDLRGRGTWTLTPTAGRYARALRLAGPRRPQAAEGPHARAAPTLPLEPQLGDRPRDGRPGALRAQHAPPREAAHA